MITEKPRSLLDKILFKPRKYEVPDILDHTINQPYGVKINIRGHKNDSVVTLQTSQNQFSFNTVYPGIRFIIAEDSDYGLRFSPEGQPIIIIPQLKTSMEDEPVLSLFHEIGHVISLTGSFEWLNKLVEAQKTLKLAHTYQAVWGTALSKNTDRAQKQKEAHAVSLQEERRAWTIALTEIRILRKLGLDPLPNRFLENIMTFVNSCIESHVGEFSEFGVSATRKRESGWEFLARKLVKKSRKIKPAIFINR